MAERRKRLTRPQKMVVTLGLVVLIVGLLNLGRAAMALLNATWLPNLPITVTWPYLAVTAGFWGVVLSACGIALIALRGWGRWATLVTVTLHQAFVWLDHLLFDASDYASQTRPQDLALTILFLIFVWALLFTPAVRKAFKT